MSANARCYFDMLDNCVMCDLGDVIATLGNGFQLVDSGLYALPFGYDPLGRSAVELYMYSVEFVA